MKIEAHFWKTDLPKKVSGIGNLKIYFYILIPVTEIITPFVKDSIMNLLHHSFLFIKKKNNLASEYCLPFNNRCEKWKAHSFWTVATLIVKRKIQCEARDM